MFTPLTIRPATSADSTGLRRLAQLDSSTLPAAPLLVAEQRGRLVAAHSLATSHAVADPFLPTALARRLLAVQAAALA